MRLNLDWRWHEWRDLDPDTLYDCLRLRSAAFVIEQNCVFPDMDGLDPQCTHLTVRERGALLGYLRLLPPGVRGSEASLGRIVVAREARNEGLARAIAREGVRECQTRFPERDIVISGQQHLEAFYSSIGFAVDSKPYVEDGIWHVDMRLRWMR